MFKLHNETYKYGIILCMFHKSKLRDLSLIRRGGATKDSTFALPNAKNTNMLVFLALGDAHFTRFTRRETEKLRFTRRQPPTPASGI